jgi:hypothetical protein
MRDENSRPFLHLSSLIPSQFGESYGVTGGYVVPPDLSQRLLAIAAEAATFRTRAFVQPMASATLQFPYLDMTTVQSAGNSPFFGGVIASWTGDAQTRQETKPQFKMMELKAQEPSGYTVSSNVLPQDAAFGLEKLLFILAPLKGAFPRSGCRPAVDGGSCGANDVICILSPVQGAATGAAITQITSDNKRRGSSPIVMFHAEHQSLSAPHPGQYACVCVYNSPVQCNPI